MGWLARLALAGALLALAGEPEPRLAPGLAGAALAQSGDDSGGDSGGSDDGGGGDSSDDDGGSSGGGGDDSSGDGGSDSSGGSSESDSGGGSGSSGDGGDGSDSAGDDGGSESGESSDSAGGDGEGSGDEGAGGGGAESSDDEGGSNADGGEDSAGGEGAEGSDGEGSDDGGGTGEDSAGGEGGEGSDDGGGTGEGSAGGLGSSGDEGAGGSGDEGDEQGSSGAGSGSPEGDGSSVGEEDGSAGAGDEGGGPGAASGDHSSGEDHSSEDTGVSGEGEASGETAGAGSGAAPEEPSAPPQAGTPAPDAQPTAQTEPEPEAAPAPAAPGGVAGAGGAAASVEGAGGPAAAGTAAERKAAVEARAAGPKAGATGQPAAEAPRTGLSDLVRRVLGGAPRPARVEAPVQEAVAPVAPAVAPRVAPAVEPEVPEATAPAVEAAKAKEPPSAARAPRIELSSGDRAGSYRQYEITALGLTPRARQVVGALGFRILSERRSALLGDRVVAKLRTPRNQTATAALQRVRGALPEVVFDYAHLYRPSGEHLAGGAPAPVRYPAEMIGAPAAGVCVLDVRIGLIDSGVGRHPSLAGARIASKTFVERDAATNVVHGTAIASILVGDLPGSGALLPDARLFAANVFAQEAGGLRADAPAIIAALDWMAAQGVPVVNLSLMGPANALLEAAVQAAAQRGQILVAAAGNDGPGGDPAYPAAYPAVIAVAALDARGRPYGGNNRGSYIYVTAPGVDIWGADARGGEAFWTGTSFAAPFVAAALARDIAAGRVGDVNEARARIAASARDLGAPGRDPIFGHGLLQAGGCGGAPSVVSSRD